MNARGRRPGAWLWLCLALASAAQAAPARSLRPSFLGLGSGAGPAWTAPLPARVASPSVQAGEASPEAAARRRQPVNSRVASPLSPPASQPAPRGTEPTASLDDLDLDALFEGTLEVQRQDLAVPGHGLWPEDREVEDDLDAALDAAD